MQGRIGLVPTMNIKDPQVRGLAMELARRRHTSMTDAVRQALAEALDRDRSQGAVGRRLSDAAVQWRAAGGTVVSEEDLYDEEGLPR